MRDRLKDKTYYEKYLAELNEMIRSNEALLHSNQIDTNRSSWILFATFKYKLNKAVAQYSNGSTMEIVRNSYLDALQAMLQGGWVAETTRVQLSPGNYSDQYMIEPYYIMLKMLSLAYLLKIPDDRFNQLVELINEDKINDRLYTSIIAATFSVEKQEPLEVYEKQHSKILLVFEKLRLAIAQTDSGISLKLLKQYLTKDFYNRYTGFYNSHKSRAMTYYGYWSFETSAFAKILVLDDEELRSNKYYPVDMVNYFEDKATPLV